MGGFFYYLAVIDSRLVMWTPLVLLDKVEMLHMRTGTLTKELQHLCDHWQINLALKVTELVCGANNEISDLSIYILVSYAQLHYYYY